MEVPVKNDVQQGARAFRTALEGTVRTSAIEGAMLDHRYMQPLRGQRTRPGLQYAFPDANHGRFSQALGCCDLASKFFSALLGNARDEVWKRRIRDMPREGELAGFDALMETFGADALEQAVRFTAMFLHAGHGPWGGIGPFAPTLAAVADWFRSPSRFVPAKGVPSSSDVERTVELGEGKKRQARVYEAPLGLLDPLVPAILGEISARQARGEASSWPGLRAGVVFAVVAGDVFRSRAMLERTWSFVPDEARDRTREGGAYAAAVHASERFVDARQARAFLVAAAALMELPPSSDMPEPVGMWAPFVRDVVAGVPVGADRVASLMRDRQTCGVSYGNIPVEDLLRSLLPVLEQGRVRVAWRRSGVGAVERVIFEAYGMALHVHGTKGCDAAERMMRRALDAWGPISPRILDLSTLPSYLAFLEGFGRDDAFLALLSGHMSVAGRTSHPPFTDIPRRLVARNLYQSVGTFRDIDEAKGARIAEAVRREAGAWAGTVFAVSVGDRAAADLLEAPARILAPDLQGVLCRLYPPGTTWASVTGILAAMAIEPPFVRVYADPDDAGSPLPASATNAAMDAYHGFMDVGSPRPSARLVDAVEPAPVPPEPDDALLPAAEPDDTGGQ
jgi:hypothetical protein